MAKKSLMPAWPEIIAGTVKLGAATIIGLGLVYWLTQKIDTKLDTMGVDLRNMQESVRKNAALFQVAQRICINTAKTDQQRIECVTIHDDK